VVRHSTSCRLKPELLQRLTILLLVLGLGSSLIIYVTAKPVIDDPLVGNLHHSKKYVHELGVIGGKANVAVVDLIADLDELWHGRALAGTIAVLTIAVTLAVRFVALRPGLFAALCGRDDPPSSDSLQNRP
jgi:hypothetical protein